MSKIRSALISLCITLVSVVVCLVAAEVVLRVKNSSMRNYDIEMWRYAKELKTKVDDPALDFDHLHSREALLQSVPIRLNEEGLRGPPLMKPSEYDRRILFLGGSITLGWGVPEDQTVTARLQAMFRQAGQRVEVLNGGIGNYNAERYVSRFFKELTELKPNDIVVHYFLRDAEDLKPGESNFILRNSELAVTLWIAYHRLFDRNGEQSLVDHYKEVYRPDAPGYLKMQEELKKLADYGKAHGIRMTLAMVPDVHNLVDYKLEFVDRIMGANAKELGYDFVDLLPAMRGLPPQDLWAMPGDPHPNGLGHKLMADAIFKVLEAPAPAPVTQ